MTLIDHKHFHHFFANKKINELYGAMAIFRFGVSLIALYVPIFMYQRGFSISQILMFFVIAATYYTLFSIPSSKFTSRFGVKHTMLLSLPILVAYYLGLNYLHPGSMLYYILPGVASAHSVLFNIAYHLNFIEHAERDKTARQMTVLSMISNIVQFASPFLGGIIIMNYGFGANFALGSIIIVLSMLPLLLTKDVHEPMSFSVKDIWHYIISKKHLGMNLSFLGYAVESIISFLLWPVFLIIMLKTVAMVGGVVSLTAFFTITTIYFIAKLADKWDKKKLIRIGTILHFFGWLGRLFVYSPLTIFSVDTYKNISLNTVQIPLGAYFYEVSHKKNYFELIVAREIIFNVSRIVVLPLLVLLLKFSGLGFKTAFVVAALFSLLYMCIKE
jgi:MFS family permease